MINAIKEINKNDFESGCIKINQSIFDPVNRIIKRNQNTIDIEPKVAELLSLLCSAKGTLSRDLILSSLWGHSGSDEALTQTVSKLRRALGDTKRPYRIIKTVPTVGYQLSVKATAVTDTALVQSESGHVAIIQLVQRLFTKNISLIKGAVIGASFTLLAVSILDGNKVIETEIECPTDWTPKDCIELVAAGKSEE